MASSASSNATPYYPISIIRSDGQADKVPPAQHITLKANEKGQVISFTRQEDSDSASLQWRIKLAKSLVEDAQGGETNKQHILARFPAGYSLWKQTKDNPSKSKDNRQDYYLYGHGSGKRFRSPNQFLPHLLWMAKESKSDCPCEICSGVERKEKKDIKKETEAGEAESSQEPSDKREIATIIKLPLSTGALHTTLPREQEVDSEVNGKFMYRPGEMVWFNRGVAWGLSVICKRQEANPKARYLLQPLSHPLDHPLAQIKDQDSIRPWLAWSVPLTTHTQIANLRYDEVPWDRVLRGELGAGDAEVDGSILAAKAIDGCYTFFDRLSTSTASTNEVHYAGMFLGAEKIWVGEPVRLRLPNKSDIAVMVIHQMAERVTEVTSPVTITGDIYKLEEIPTPFKDRKDWPTPDLPARMVADLRFRNEIADNAKRGIWYEWRLIESMAPRALYDIKGRWYETRTLLPVLRGAEYQQDAAKGISSDAGLWMNSRGDSSNGINQRKKNRVDTLGGAVPPNLKISRGLNGRPEDDRFPDEQPNLSEMATQVMGSSPYTSVAGPVEQDLDQFMNLDHAAEQQDFYGSSMQH